ncbi:MAG: gamma-glutamyltransferase [Haloarculaceae archaeon]
MNDDPNLDRFASRRSTVRAPRGVVATSQPLAAEAGLRILREGGNAFDAAVATAAALNVVEPTSTGLGGDVFAAYRTADGEVGAMRSCGASPADATLDDVREAVADEQGVAPEEAEMPTYGPHAITVPGTAAGWEATVSELGRTSLGTVLEPAIEYAVEGYPVSEIIARQWRESEEVLRGENARDAYERTPYAGDVVTLPQLGETLERIASEGAEVVYEGDIAETIAAEVQDRGGFLSESDLASHEVEWPELVSTTYRGAEVFELPPNNQGLIALEALNVAEELGVEQYPTGSEERVHYMVEAFKRAMRDGHHYITDPAFAEVPPLADKTYAAARAREVGATASDPDLGPLRPPAETADTVLLTTADADGNVVSYINSRFKDFGSGVVAGDTGIALQNRGSSFHLDPDHPNRFEPGKRSFHTLIPGLARMGDDDWMAFGVMGGYMQPQGHMQVLSGLLDDGVSLQEALDAPRWRVHTDHTVAVEGRMDGELQTKLARRGHDVTVRPPLHFGGGQIARNREGVLEAATDPRKDGSAVGY